MAMTKVVSFKVADEAANLQGLLTSAAKKAGMPVWQFLTQMLELWNQLDTVPAPDKLEALRQMLEAELETSRIEREALTARVLEVEKKAIEAIEKATKIQEREIQRLMEGLPENQVNQVNLNNDVNIEAKTDIEAFEATYGRLERDHHAMIWQLREELDWSVERFDAVIRQLRDAEKYQPMQGAATENMTKWQLKSSFVDENKVRFHTVMRVRNPIVEPEQTETPPAPKRRGRPPKAKKE